MVGLGGLEPPTSPLSGVHSNQLSYSPLTDYKTQTADYKKWFDTIFASCVEFL